VETANAPILRNHPDQKSNRRRNRRATEFNDQLLIAVRRNANQIDHTTRQGFGGEQTTEIIMLFRTTILTNVDIQSRNH
jgi:hypothetical protein